VIPASILQKNETSQEGIYQTRSEIQDVLSSVSTNASDTFHQKSDASVILDTDVKTVFHTT